MPALFANAIERPTGRTPSVRENAIDLLLKDVLDWLRSDGDKCESEAEIASVRKQLSEATSWHTDGYEIAKVLDSRWCWSCDRELVDVLDMFSVYLHREESKAVEWWVRAYDIRPTFSIGDQVKAKWGHEAITGKVSRINKSQAQYTVSRDGDNDGYGPVVRFEDTEPSHA